MPKLKMTDAAVQRVSAGPGERVDYFDAHPRDRQRALVLRVTGSQLADGSIKVTRSWDVLCRVRGNRKLRRFNIGDYPTYSLAQARAEAAEIVKKAGRSIDPMQEREKSQREAEIAGKDTIGALVKRFMGDLAKRPKKKGGKRAPRYIEETQRNFDNHVLPRWRLKNIREIGRRDISDLLDAVADDGTVVHEQGEQRHVKGGGTASDRTQAAVRAFFNWCVDGGIIEANPALRLARRGEETPRERVLSDDEIRVIWPASKQRGYPFGLFYQLALITAQRRDEVASMRWAEIDEKERTWSLPPARTKAGRAHVVPLSAIALRILSDAKKIATDIAKAENRDLGPFVFSTSGKTPISGYSRAKARLDVEIEKTAHVPAWTIHDLRRTAATQMAALGVSQFDIARVLNHADRSVTAIYNRHSYLTEKRAALDAWARHIHALVDPAVGNVVPMRRGPGK